ncbi:MAG: SPOR domain-containing protein, partial [Candidatus Omnitrophica bacterium]|nr:SPOR domain-containing protein [Candidatus Omnitrophota bacterium]
KELLKVNSSTRLIALVNLKLAQISLKQGKWNEAQNYLNKLKNNYPLSLEQKIAKDVWSDDFYFTLQVGSFSTENNAQALKDKLTEKGYPAYVEATKNQDKALYRVRVGKLKTRPEAEDLEKKLAEEGYPARIFP